MSTQDPLPAEGSTVTTEVALAPVVHVVDDEASIQDLFHQLGRLEHLEIRSYRCAAEFLRTAAEPRSSCLVLDLNLPDQSGLSVLEELSRRDSRPPVVFMSGMAKVSEAVHALKHGSIDFVEKPFTIDAMLAAIRRALQIDDRQRQQQQGQQALRQRFAALTPREAEVMQLVVDGLPNKAMAARLGVSPKTIEVHRANVMRKTAAESLADLVRMAITMRDAGGQPAVAAGRSSHAIR